MLGRVLQLSPLLRARGSLVFRMAGCGPRETRVGNADPHAPHRSGPSELKQLLDAERSGHSFLSLRDASGCMLLHVLALPLDRCTIGRRPTADLPIPWD